MTAERVTNLYNLMDSAYDAPEIGWHNHLLGHVPIIDINPRDRDFKEELAREAKAQRSVGHRHPADERYDERSNVERINAGLKDNCGARHVRVRGHANLTFGRSCGLDDGRGRSPRLDLDDPLDIVSWGKWLARWSRTSHTFSPTATPSSAGDRNTPGTGDRVWRESPSRRRTVPSATLVRLSNAGTQQRNCRQPY